MNGIPKSERVWVTIRNRKKECCHVITSKQDSRNYYYLYECTDDSVSRLGRARSPVELEQQWPL